MLGSTFLPGAVTAQAQITAQKAYDQFCRAAIAYLTTNPWASVSIALSAFSRGDAAAAIFSQLVFENGVCSGNTVYIPPGQVGVSGGVLFDPVTTGDRGNLGFSPNVRNFVDIVANNEYRIPFESTNYGDDPSQISCVNVYGNHCDIGGGYDNGIAGLTLQAGVDFLRNSGLQVPSPSLNDRQYISSEVAIHEEDKLGPLNWPSYGVFQGGGKFSVTSIKFNACERYN